MATTPPGWYDDGHGALRWWDGAQWTEHVAAPDPETEGATAPTEADIVAANSQAPAEVREAEPVEVDAATALGLGVPPAAGAPAYSQYAGEPAGDHPQGAYPGGYPGADASAGAFVAATEPRKSKLWILWVVLGVVMLGIVVAAAIVIPLLFLNLATGGGSAGGGAVQPSGADEEAAVAAVELYDDAWQDVDCDAFTASTSEDFRALSGLEDCVAFQDTATDFATGVEDYLVTVTDIEADGGSIVITTSETYDALFDNEMEPLDPPQPTRVEYEYTVIEVDGDWVIDNLTE